MKKFLFTGFFVIQLFSFFYAYSSAVEDKPIMTAKMEIIEAYGNFENAKDIEIALVKEESASNPTGVVIVYVVPQNGSNSIKIQITNVKNDGCRIEYRAWNKDSKYDIIITDRRNCGSSLKFTIEAEVTRESSYMALAGNPY